MDLSSHDCADRLQDEEAGSVHEGHSIYEIARALKGSKKEERELRDALLAF